MKSCTFVLMIGLVVLLGIIVLVLFAVNNFKNSNSSAIISPENQDGCSICFGRPYSIAECSGSVNSCIKLVCPINSGEWYLTLPDKNITIRSVNQRRESEAYMIENFQQNKKIYQSLKIPELSRFNHGMKRYMYISNLMWCHFSVFVYGNNILFVNFLN